MRTYSPKASELTHNWFVIDATDVVLGRLAAQAAALLRGKHKPTFAAHMDNGDFVVIINAEKVALTGSKLTKKMAYRHSGYPGGLTATSYAELLDKNPVRAVEKAIRGMLPKNSLGDAQLRKLKVYAGNEHPHEAQQPTKFVFDQVAQ
ncbi:MAG: 50S ribosomal protein L13 [Actinobacteria bacterium]|uniref:Unannotated protein n=1 Tax=freshwater metagenome TaxID=449393 RepID=A0A6J6ESK5_9ZZZZ|nr:50S ribosomal protein L13 [Actinomycetota bacterium]MTA89540.1 50S ribosomal protein L13 [Actinomycetota bacterium]